MTPAPIGVSLTLQAGEGRHAASRLDRARHHWHRGLELWHGPLGPVLHVTAACVALLVSGLSLSLTGQLDWGPGLYGERAVFAVALGAAGYALWLLGARTPSERRACWATLAASLLALGLFPAGSRLEFNAAILGVHLGLCWQLLAWAGAARKAPKLGLWILAAGMAVECVNIIVSQLAGIGITCSTATMAACLSGPFAPAIVPCLMLIALVLLWLNPIMRALDGRRLDGR